MLFSSLPVQQVLPHPDQHHPPVEDIPQLDDVSRNCPTPSVPVFVRDPRLRDLHVVRVLRRHPVYAGEDLLVGEVAAEGGTVARGRGGGGPGRKKEGVCWFAILFYCEQIVHLSVVVVDIVVNDDVIIIIIIIAVPAALYVLYSCR